MKVNQEQKKFDPANVHLLSKLFLCNNNNSPRCRHTHRLRSRLKHTGGKYFHKRAVLQVKEIKMRSSEPKEIAHQEWARQKRNAQDKVSI